MNNANQLYAKALDTLPPKAAAYIAYHASGERGTLADLFEAHKTDFIASGKRSYHHYETQQSVISDSGLLPETTIAKKITKEILDRIQHHALHDVSSVHYDRYDYREEKLEATSEMGKQTQKLNR